MDYKYKLSFNSYFMTEKEKDSVRAVWVNKPKPQLSPREKEMHLERMLNNAINMRRKKIHTTCLLEQ